MLVGHHQEMLLISKTLIDLQILFYQNILNIVISHLLFDNSICMVLTKYDQIKEIMYIPIKISKEIKNNYCSILNVKSIKFKNKIKLQFIHHLVGIT
jgi:hypothetical protein